MEEILFGVNADNVFHCLILYIQKPDQWHESN